MKPIRPRTRLTIVFALAVGCTPVAEPVALTDGGDSDPVAHTEPGAATAASCGQAPQPRCPLQEWMHKNLASPLVSENVRELAPKLESLALLVPEGYSDWSDIASRGADAAAHGDVPRLRSQCAACHTAYRRRYRGERGPMVLPAAMLGTQ